MNEKKEKSSVKAVINNNIMLLKLCFLTDRKYIFLFAVDVIRNDLCYFFEYAFGLNFVLECVEYKRPIKYAIGYLIFLFLFVSVCMIYSAWFNEKYKFVTLPRIKANYKKMLFDKAKEVDLACYDNPDYYNNFIFAINESDNQIDRAFELLKKVLVCVVNILLIGGFFIVHDYIALVFIFASFLLTMIFNKALAELVFRIKEKRNTLERKNDYVNRIFYLRDYAKEIRLNTKLSSILLKDFKKTNDDIQELERKNGAKRFFLGFMNGYFCESLIRDIIYVIYLLYKAMVQKVISYSTMVVLYRTASRLQSCIQSLATIYPYALETSLYVDKIKHFLDTKAEVVTEGNAKIPENPKVLELKHVYFSYSNDENYVLKDINMKIEFSNKVAIVGFNGAGKTTLIKLIMRLYDVTKGEITLDGINIKEYDVDEYREKIGVIFQDFNLYALTLAENVKLDNVEDINKMGIRNALIKSGFDLNGKLQKINLDTQITKEFDDKGVSLSGGEGQKVAVSRVFFSEKPMFILDEPSAKLDPIAEYELNKSMMSLAENRKVIFISHRLSTTRLSDRIYVLENGQIIEKGNHDELLSYDGVYAKMWKAQARHFAETN